MRSPFNSEFDADLYRLFSFGKFLEVLVYSPKVPTISPALCEHTKPSADSRGKLPESRFNIIRHFSTSKGTVSFSLSSIEDIFELRVPRLQVHKGLEKVQRPGTDSSQATSESGAVEDEKRILRKEIREWWEGVADHIDSLVSLSPPFAYTATY